MRLLVLAKDSKLNGWEGAAGPQSGPGLEPMLGVFLRPGPALGTGELRESEEFYQADLPPLQKHRNPTPSLGPPALSPETHQSL